MSDVAPRGYDFFISHASDEAAAARAIVELLEAASFRCWIAPRNVRAAEPYAAEIVRGIDTSKHFVLLHTPAADRSDYIISEVNHAFAKKKRILEVMPAAFTPSEAMSFYLSAFQRLALSGTDARSIARAIREAARPETRATSESIGPPRKNRTRYLVGGTAVGALLALTVWRFQPEAAKNGGKTPAGDSTAGTGAVASTGPRGTSEAATKGTPGEPPSIGPSAAAMAAVVPSAEATPPAPPPAQGTRRAPGSNPDSTFFSQLPGAATVATYKPALQPGEVTLAYRNATAENLHLLLFDCSRHYEGDSPWLEFPFPPGDLPEYYNNFFIGKGWVKFVIRDSQGAFHDLGDRKLFDTQETTIVVRKSPTGFRAEFPAKKSE